MGKCGKAIGVEGMYDPQVRDRGQAPTNPPLQSPVLRSQQIQQQQILSIKDPLSPCLFLPSSLPQRKDKKQFFLKADNPKPKTQKLEWSVTNFAKLVGHDSPRDWEKPHGQAIQQPCLVQKSGPKEHTFQIGQGGGIDQHLSVLTAWQLLQ